MPALFGKDMNQLEALDAVEMGSPCGNSGMPCGVSALGDGSEKAICTSMSACSRALQWQRALLLLQEVPAWLEVM